MREAIQESSLPELRDLLDQRKLSSVELTKLYLDEIDNREEIYNAFITVTPESALRQAEEADRRLAAGEKIAPLTGIPVGLKDVICVRGATDHRRVAVFASLPASLRRHRSGTSSIGGSRVPGKNQLRRVCHGFLQRELLLRTGQEPVEPEAYAGRK